MKKPEALRVIKLIEKLTYLYYDTDESHLTATNTIDQIYRFSHLFSSCSNKHLDWLKEFYNVEKEMKEY